MYTLLIVLHVIFCVFLILVILLQTGKGAGIGATFGGGGSGSGTVFGPRGAGSFIGKLTGGVAAAFMLTSVTLAYLSSSGTTGIADKASALNESVTSAAEEVDISESSEPIPVIPVIPVIKDSGVGAGETDASVPTPAPVPENALQ
jgi:preprotein translocase subunit SecG